jgi:O-acetyl-ADP-ribose deacetylase (regulator of RNase III)
MTTIEQDPESTVIFHGDTPIRLEGFGDADVRVCRGDITKSAVDAIVCPANTFLVMRGGASAAIREAGNRADQIEKDAVALSPIRIGDAVLTRGYSLPAAYVIHAPTVEMPVDRATVDSVELAMRASLRAINRHSLRSVAFPSLGTGTGGITYGEAAGVMLRELRRDLLSGKSTVARVQLVAFEEGFMQALQVAATGTSSPGVTIVPPPLGNRQQCLGWADLP